MSSLADYLVLIPINCSPSIALDNITQRYERKRGKRFFLTSNSVDLCQLGGPALDMNYLLLVGWAKPFFYKKKPDLAKSSL